MFSLVQTDRQADYQCRHTLQ